MRMQGQLFCFGLTTKEFNFDEGDAASKILLTVSSTKENLLRKSSKEKLSEKLEVLSHWKNSLSGVSGKIMT